ncbi:MAG: YhbY family RNA-binding protein [Verrucomicrobiae bacterium]|nr:YhbY family RNA-binding protein [Verrucomicrobiae bacterium]
MSEELTNATLRDLKARAQRLEAVLHVGKSGLSDSLLSAVGAALKEHELIKIKFVAFKEEKKTLAPLLAEKTSSRLVMRVGNVAVLFRPRSRSISRPNI